LELSRRFSQEPKSLIAVFTNIGKRKAREFKKKAGGVAPEPQFID
jgi:hypothetical protein